MTDEMVVFMDAASSESEARINALIGGGGWTVHAIDPIPGSTFAIAVLRWGGPGRPPRAKGVANAPVAS